MSWIKHLQSYGENLDFRFERTMGSCFPYSLACLAKLNEYKDLRINSEDLVDNKTLNVKIEKMWRICGCSQISGSYTSVISDNLRELGYRVIYFGNSEKIKQFLTIFPKEFMSSPIVSGDSLDIFLLGEEEFKKTLHDYLENRNPVIGLEFLKDRLESHFITIITQNESVYWITDTYHCIKDELKRLERTNLIPILNKDLEDSLYGFLVIEKE